MLRRYSALFFRASGVNAYILTGARLNVLKPDVDAIVMDIVRFGL